MKEFNFFKCNNVLLLLYFVFGLIACDDNGDSVDVGQPYDPNRLVKIVSFTPEEGNVKTKIVITGENFGVDTTMVEVSIGGVKAPLIGLKNNLIYCTAPNNGYEGTLSVKVGEQTAVAEKKFSYKADEMRVTTFYGNRMDDGRFEVMDGPIDESFTNYLGVESPTWFSFNPNNHDELYMAQDNDVAGGARAIRVFDLKKRTLRTTWSYTERLRTLDWSITGDTLFVAIDRGGDENTSTAVLALTKDTDGEFRNVQEFAHGMQCNGAAVHPINYEMYFNNYGKGLLFRFDYQTYGGGLENSRAHRETMCAIQDNDWEFNIVMHPTGKYAYLVIVNRHYIMRMNYDEVNKRFGMPYRIAGAVGEAGWTDGVGTAARFNTPYQGIFVKNPAYAGNEDEYDFYITDRHNHCIRVLSPQGLVSTFAGRGSASLNENANGYVDGALREDARFDQPMGLAYDERTNTFYVGDVQNHRIRMISYVSSSDEETAGDKGDAEGDNVDND